MRFAASGTLLFVMALPALAQNISGEIRGEVVDPGGAAVANAQVTLVSSGTGAGFRSTTNTNGVFVYPSVTAGGYRLEIQSPGFRKYVRNNIALTASEIRDLGKLQLVLGEVRETVSVEDTATPLQMASGEKSGLISGTQLNNLALKGRDFAGFLTLMPGVVDNGTQPREATSANGFQSIYINGNRSETKNFTVDGVTDVDTGSGGSGIHYEPNMDSIAEVKVMTSNYQAEFGRAAGGLISVVTKSGTQQFHGSGWWTHRHEEFNANNFFSNRAGLAKAPYRYNIAGFSVGGPAYIPGKFNSGKSKLFFFASQEYTQQRVDFGSKFDYMPTALERAGDFSRSFDPNGKLLTITDPTARTPFPNNVIPANRIDRVGQGILKFFPMPNYTPAAAALVNQQNYATAASGGHPRRNDMVRIDVYPFSKLTGYFRWIRDADEADNPFQYYNFAYSPSHQIYPAHGYAAHLAYTASPSLLNEFILGKSWNSVANYPTDANAVSRQAVGNPPEWYAQTPVPTSAPGYLNYPLMPSVQFGNTPVNAPTAKLSNNWNFNNTWDITDNLNWVKGDHRLKAGFYLFLTDKVQVGNPSSPGSNGSLDFSANANNPFNSGNGFANALLGVFNTYSESTRNVNFDAKYYNLEFYVQDNWRVTNRLTLDYGIRFYHAPPQVDLNYSVAAFDSNMYKLSDVPRLYRPGFDANGKRAAINPLTGAATYPALIGMFVPGSGNPANGMMVGGKDGYPWGLYTVPALSATPRFGFAYDLTGKGATVIRGGAGIFIDRTRQLITWGTANQPPIGYMPTEYYGNLGTLTQSAGALGPSNVTFAAPAKRAQQQSVTNFSLGVQHQLPLGMVADVSYVGSVSSHLLDQRNLNAIPAGARLSPANGDPTTPGKPLPDNFLRPYAGFGDLNVWEFASSANYHSLQSSLQRRFGNRLGLGASYTFSKALGVASAFSGVVSSYFSPRQWNYGPLSFDRSQVFTLNYQYDVPNPAARWHNKVLNAITDQWTISGITTFMSGAPFTPSQTTTTGMEISGSSETARITVVGNPVLGNGDKSFTRNFAAEAFALTPVGGFGNAGSGILRGPGVNNWDLSLGKKIPVGLGEGRTLQFRAEAYNAWNHTQFSALDTTARFNPAGVQANTTFGWYTAARAPRIVSFALRFAF